MSKNIESIHFVFIRWDCMSYIYEYKISLRLDVLVLILSVELWEVDRIRKYTVDWTAERTEFTLTCQCYAVYLKPTTFLRPHWPALKVNKYSYNLYRLRIPPLNWRPLNIKVCRMFFIFFFSPYSPKVITVISL